jgi:transcriptional regulator with XRE-family HTH domain
MTTATPTIGQDFAARIEALGISQEFLAQYVGLSQSEISKLISGVRPQGEGHRKINDALRDLENVVECFRPMKPLFDDADAVKEWLCSPSLPNLFKLLTDAQLKQLSAQELTTVNAMYAEGERLEAEIATLQEETRKKFIDWLENPRGR